MTDGKCTCCCEKVDCKPKRKIDDHIDNDILNNCLQQPDEIQYHEINASSLNTYLKKLKCLKNKKPEETEKKCYEKRFYQFGLIAKIDINTTDCDLKRLLKFSFRTFLVQTAYYGKLQLEQILLKLNTNIGNYQLNSIHNMPMGLAVEIRGDVTRLGRLRNDGIEEIKTGSIICLTSNEEYQYVSLKEILYVSNLWRYLSYIKINDIITLDNRNVTLKVIKIINRTITVCVINGGVISSYMDVNIPYYIKEYEPSRYDCEDVQFAYANSAHFLVIPNIRSHDILKGFKEYFETKFGQKFEIIGKLDLNYLRMKTCEICDILRECTAIWIDDLVVKCSKKFHINKIALRIINMANSFNKPIITTIPIKTRKDFISLEKAAIFKSVQSFLIEKSDITDTFPIIAKKLLPIPRALIDFKLKDIDLKDFNNNISAKGLVNTLNYTIHQVQCSGVIVTATNIESIISLSSIDIYCPVIAIVQNEYLGKTLNIYRNMNTVLFEPDHLSLEPELEIFRAGLYFGVDMKLFVSGDLVLRFEDIIVGEINVSKMLASHVPKHLVSLQQRKFLAKKCLKKTP